MGKHQKLFSKPLVSIHKGLESFLQEQQLFLLSSESLRSQTTDGFNAPTIKQISVMPMNSLNPILNRNEETYVQDEYFEQMRALGRYYDELENEIQALLNRMHALLTIKLSAT